jgi:hypothetical protein
MYMLMARPQGMPEFVTAKCVKGESVSWGRIC